MGNIELRTWATLLGAVGERSDVYCYEPSWHHGNAVIDGRYDARSASGPPR